MVPRKVPEAGDAGASVHLPDLIQASPDLQQATRIVVGFSDRVCQGLVRHSGPYRIRHGKRVQGRKEGAEANGKPFKPVRLESDRRDSRQVGVSNERAGNPLRRPSVMSERGDRKRQVTGEDREQARLEFELSCDIVVFRKAKDPRVVHFERDAVTTFTEGDDAKRCEARKLCVDQFRRGRSVHKRDQNVILADTPRHPARGCQ